MVQKLCVATAVALTALGLVGCNELEPNKSRFEICIEAGGSFVGNAWGDECYTNGEKPESEN